MPYGSAYPSTLRNAILVLFTCLAAILPANAQLASTLRSDRVSLRGAWKFQLRHDNPLDTTGPVKFGPLKASSQILFKEPDAGESPLARVNLAQPWGLAATLAGPGVPRDPAQAIWKPHPKQQGPTWWEANLGGEQRLDSVRINWVKPGDVRFSVEISEDGAKWSVWVSGRSKPDDDDTTLSAPRANARFVRISFIPAQFEGTRKIEVRLRDSLDRLTLWQPAVRKTWYEDLRKYTPDGFQLASFDDAQWSAVQVPGHWEAQGYGKPDWFQPNDEVGYYRRAFTLPDAWQGRHLRLRLEGANNGTHAWLNGKEVGYHEGGVTPFEYDVTRLVKFGAPNLIAVRVSKHTLTSEYETDDAFFLGGLWRDVVLYSLPADHIEDFTVRTEFDPVYQNAVLKAELKLRAGSPDIARECAIEGTLIDASGKEVPLDSFRAHVTLAGEGLIEAELRSIVKGPRKWTAETPYLYSLVLRLKSAGKVIHEIKTSVGFRKVEVKGMRLLVNGVPVEIRGVVTVRMNPNDAGEPADKVFAREIHLLKESNINALRSHTVPLEEEFLDLCDKHGIYVLPDVPYVWAMEEDFSYLTDDLVRRAKEIYEAHKNHPSVILWHVGNENHPTTAYLGGGQAARWLEKHDPTRPVAICRNLADDKEFGATVSDLHYDPMTYPEFREINPTPVLFGEFHAVPNEIRRLKDLGFVETWGRSLQQEWTAYRDRYPYVVGGLICCWEDGSVSGDLGFNQWGVVDSKHHAKPVLHYVRQSYAPVRLALQGLSISDGQLGATLKVTNRYNFTNLDGFDFQWELQRGDQALSSGRESYRVSPMAFYQFPLSLTVPPGADRLRFSVSDADGFSILDQEFPLPVASAPTSMSEFLKSIGVKEASSAPTGTGAGIRAVAAPDGQVKVQDSEGREILTVRGFASDAEDTTWTNLLSGAVRYQPAQQQGSTITIPFTVSGGTKDKKVAWQLPGTLLVESGASWVRVLYTLSPDREVLIPEAGLRLLLSPQSTHLSWNRRALWSTSPQAWHDGSLEEHFPLSVLRELVSKRHVMWTSLEGDVATIMIVPFGSTTNLRTGSSAEEIVLSDFLASGNFLGKFDKTTADKKLAAGAPFTGGFTLYFLEAEQKSKLANLSAPEKDLTWAPRVKSQSAN